jgi:DNA-binding response OmpR family regulator
MHTSDEAATEQLTAREGVPSEAQPIRVLLVEDNPGDTRLIRFMLADAGGSGFQMEPVDRLQAAFTRLALGGIDVVLVDLSLPDSHGLATFTELHRRVPEIPIIVLSGLDDTTLAVTAVHEGAQDYLIKGQVDGQLLVRAMRFAFDRIRLASQLGRYAVELRA